MTLLIKLSHFISRLCQLLGGLSLLVIVLTTMLDVVTRYLFRLTGGASGLTIKGPVEIVSYCMMFALLAAFVAYVERSQIIVDVFTQKMSKTMKGYMMGIFMLGYVVIGCLFTIGFYESAMETLAYGTTTHDLRISLAPIYMMGAFLSVLLTLRSLIESLKIFKTGEFFDAEETGA